MARKRITDITIRNIKAPSTGRLEIWDSDVPGFGLRVTSNGARSWNVLFRLRGRALRYTFSAHAFATVKAARAHAREALALVARGENPAERLKPAADGPTFGDVAKDFVRRYAKPRNRRWRETERILTAYCRSWHDRPIRAIRRSDVAELLERIEGRKIRHNGRQLGGPVMADRVLSALRKCFNWQAVAGRDDTFESPIVMGMREGSSKPRERILSDAEIFAVWHCAGQLGTFGAIVRVLLLTGQRRGEVAGMRRGEIDGATWVIPAARVKSKIEHAIPLSAAVRAIIDAQPRLNSTDLAFASGRRNKEGQVAPFSSFGRGKKKLDALVLAELKRQAAARGEDPKDIELEPWCLHDLRRTVRTMLSRLKVPADEAEITIGHIPSRLRRTYDRWAYVDKKRDALDKLADEIGRIVAPPPAAPTAQSNVVPFTVRR